MGIDTGPFQDITAVAVAVAEQFPIGQRGYAWFSIERNEYKQGESPCASDLYKSDAFAGPVDFTVNAAVGFDSMYYKFLTVGEPTQAPNSITSRHSGITFSSSNWPLQSRTTASPGTFCWRYFPNSISQLWDLVSGSFKVGDATGCHTYQENQADINDIWRVDWARYRAFHTVASGKQSDDVVNNATMRNVQPYHLEEGIKEGDTPVSRNSAYEIIVYQGWNDILQKYDARDLSTNVEEGIYREGMFFVYGVDAHELTDTNSRTTCGHGPTKFFVFNESTKEIEIRSVEDFSLLDSFTDSSITIIGGDDDHLFTWRSDTGVYTWRDPASPTIIKTSSTGGLNGSLPPRNISYDAKLDLAMTHEGFGQVKGRDYATSGWPLAAPEIKYTGGPGASDHPSGWLMYPDGEGGLGLKNTGLSNYERSSQFGFEFFTQVGSSPYRRKAENIGGTNFRGLAGTFTG